MSSAASAEGAAQQAEAEAIDGSMDLMFECMEQEDTTTTTLPPPQAGKARPKGKGKAKAKSRVRKPKLCLLCKIDGNALTYCHNCKSEHDAMKKDAVDNGWFEKFDEGKSNPVLFKKRINDFRHQCQSRGHGRARALYNAARLEEIFEKSRITQQGSEYVMMDWFEFEAWYSAKKFPDDIIEQKWRLALASPEHGAVDDEGENSN